jgi:hypothetical protein
MNTFKLTIGFDTKEQLEALLEVLHSDEAADVLDPVFAPETGLDISYPDPADMD